MSASKKEHVKNLVVGCGLSGMVVAERIASQLGEPVLIIDKRAHIGGNIYDEKDPETGVTVHRYGPHVFHTNSKEVWNYLSRFTEWHPFMYRVKAVVDGTEVPVPFNLDSLHTLFPRTMATRIEEKLIASFGFNTDVPILKLRETKDEDLHLLADFIYEKVFAGYTMKQWGLTAEQLDASVSGRVPVRVGRDDRYFRDTYQAIPAEGYTAMARRMVSHPLIEVRLNTNWSDVKEAISYDCLFFTGPIDEFFDYEFGALPYRSLDLQFRNLPREFAQSGPQINFPCNYNFTRSVEYKYYLDEKTPHTTISREYPCAYSSGKNEPYYPIPSPENAALYERYAQLAASLPNTHFLGRLASYRYLNMDQTVEEALKIFSPRSQFMNEYNRGRVLAARMLSFLSWEMQQYEYISKPGNSILSEIDSYSTFEELCRGFGGESNVSQVENEKDLDAFIHDNLKHITSQMPLRIFRGQNQAAWICRSLLLRKSRELDSCSTDQFKKIIEQHCTLWNSIFSSEGINAEDWLEQLDKGNNTKKYSDFKEYMRNRIEEATKLWSIQCGMKPKNAAMAEVAAQHYGLPTHLIDFTRSPLVGLFFATYPPTRKIDTEISDDLQRYMSVICLDLDRKKIIDQESFREETLNNTESMIAFETKQYMQIWSESRKKWDTNDSSQDLLPVNRLSCIHRSGTREIDNKRSKSQMGVLVNLCTHSNLCLEDAIRLVEGEHKLHCILISRELIPHINELLEEKGINEESLGLKIK